MAGHASGRCGRTDFIAFKFIVSLFLFCQSIALPVLTAAHTACKPPAGLCFQQLFNAAANPLKSLLLLYFSSVQPSKINPRQHYNL